MPLVIRNVTGITLNTSFPSLNNFQFTWYSIWTSREIVVSLNEDLDSPVYGLQAFFTHF
jgi:hypothetical protein